MLATATILPCFFRATKLELVTVYQSPDKAYSIEILVNAKTNSWAKDLAVAGRAKSGVVRLKNTEGEILKSESCESVGMIEEVWWMEDSISIRGYDSWTYPKTHNK